MFSFENYIAAERFAPYKIARATAAQQRELYLWDSQLSQEMNKAIGQQLRIWNRNQSHQPGATHNRAGDSLHRKNPRRHPSGGSEELLKPVIETR